MHRFCGVRESGGREFFHTMEKLSAIFPRHGKTLGNFSTLWKKVFHGVEKPRAAIPRMGDGGRSWRLGEVEDVGGEGDGEAFFAEGGEDGVADVAGGGGNVVAGGVHPEEQLEL